MLNLPLIWINMYDTCYLDKYRIQKHKPKLKFQPELVQKIIKGTIRHQITILLFVPLLYYVIGWKGGLDVTGPTPALSTIIWQLFLFIICEDFIFFWTHYLFHWKWLYIYIHKEHHVYKQPTGVVSVLSDSIESIVQNQVGVWLVPALLPEKHIFTLMLWLAIRVYQTVNAHCGYDFPYVSTQYWAPWLMGGARAHDYHHQYGKWNYGSFFTIWDRIMGTYRCHIEKTQSQIN
jgi:sterol desaturase/sphingolipid hydroxylase (fatty acid hydroxylase superfamily)